MLQEIETVASGTTVRMIGCSLPAEARDLEEQ